MYKDCTKKRSLGCERGRGAYFIRLSTGIKSCLKWHSLLTDRTSASLLFDFVDRSHDYRPNWTLLGPITIINRICDQNPSVADYVRNRRGKVTNDPNGSGQYNWSTWSNIDRLYETVYFRKLSLFQYKLWMDTSTSMHTCKFINSAQFVLLFFISCDFRLDDLITYNYFGHLEYLTFCFACRLFTKTLSLHPFFNLKAVQKSSKLQKRRKQKPRKGICPEVKLIKLQDEKWHRSAFFDVANPKGNSSSKLVRIETLEERFEDLHRSFEKISSFFFVARKTIAKGKVQAKYLKHLLVNYSFILIIGFFFFFCFWKLWF